MKDSIAEEHLYLAFSHQYRDSIFPLHTSISLFLLSYCDCKLFKVFLVPTGEDVGDQCVTKNLAGDLEVHLISRCQLPVVVQSCSLPAVVVKDDKFCRAGLSVVLRHIIQKTFEADPSKKDVLGLLGFKKTCLKACAEVSQWTRLCEISIPLAVERFLTASPEHCQAIPPDILLFERKLGEPVRVHNDDKIRRQKLQQQKAGAKAAVPALHKEETEELKPGEVHEHPPSSLELSVAFSKLLVQEAPDAVNREAPDIRRTKTSDLPLLDHVFAEGLYFTVADIVLLPCIHQFLVSSKKQGKNLVNLPLISSWYRRVQEVPGVKKAAGKCNMELLQLPQLVSAPEEQLQDSSLVPDELEEDNEDSHFIGGPRPTMTKLMENGIEAKFSPHPCPNWTLDWTNLPSAVSPGEGKMSRDRALRKQQQLNNLVAAVTKLAKPGDVIVDFCSGGGHVGIVLAYMMPSCQVVLIENKELSLIRAKDRSDELGLKNIWFIQANLDYFNGTFNIGVALHACGVATDMVIEHCLRARAAFVISPCCYGFIQNTVKFKYPRSHQFKEILSYKEHMILCRFADQTAVQLPPERRLIGRTHQGDAPVGNCDAVYSKDFPTALLQAAKPVFSKKRGGEGALFGQMPKRLLGASDGQEKQPVILEEVTLEQETDDQAELRSSVCLKSQNTMSSNQRKRRGGAVDSRPAQKRSRLLPSSAGGTSQAELIDLEESGTLSFEPAGEEIIDLTGETPEPEVIDITGKSPEPEVKNIEVVELKIIVIDNDESAGEEEQSQQQPHCSRESENLAEPLARDNEEEPRENYGEWPASVYSSPLWLDESSRDWVQSPQPSHLSRPAENSAGLLMTGGEEEPRDNDGVQPAGPATPPAREDANAQGQDREQRQQHPPASSAADNSAELWASDNEEEPRDNDGSIESSDWPETVESPSTSEDDTTEDWVEFQLYPFGSRSGGNSPELLPSNLLQEPIDIEFEWPASVYSSPLWLDESSRDWVQSLQPSHLSRPAENSAGLLMTGGEEEPRDNDGEQPGGPATPSASQNANAELLEVHEQQRRNVTLNSHEQVDGSGIEPAANDAHVADPAPAEQESNQEETTHSDAQPGVVIRCPICFEFYSEIMQNGQQLVATLCGHVFCSRCLPVALENTNMCPTCRVELDPDLYIPIYL